MNAVWPAFAVFFWAVVSTGTAAAESQPSHRIGFASIAPTNAEIFLAGSAGEDPVPFLPHAGFDGNASFSPDGQWVIFSSERAGSFDIFRAHPDGTALEPLVSHPAYDDQAALSPDGASLAFVSSRSGSADIWLLELATGALRNLTQHPAGDFRPAWSPDGQWIAFTSDRESRKPTDPRGFAHWQSTEIFLIRADGTGLRRVTHANEVAGSPSWSPDGTALAYYQGSTEEVGKIVAVQPLRGTTQIATVDLTNNTQEVLTRGEGEKWSPRWISARQIAYVSGGPEGGLEILDGEQPVAGVRGEVRAPHWSRDGQRMVFHRDAEPEWGPPHQRWHSNDDQFQLLRTGVFPAFSPVGERLLCNDQRGAIISTKILMMQPDGSDREVFFDGGDKSPIGATWSPDGRSVAFAYGRFFQTILGPAIADIAVVDANGKNLRLLTDGNANVGFPSWAPDGRHIVYRLSGKEERGLFILDVETGEKRALTAPSRDNFPSWSPKGDRIAFTRYVDGDFEIFTIKPDGQDERRLTHSPGIDAHGAWSPDGEWIAFSSGRQGFKDEAALYPRNGQPYGEITVMRADGSDVRVLTDNPFEEGTVGWAPLAR